VAPVVLREGVVGYLSLLDEGAGFREIERLAIVRAAAACAIEMIRESAAAEAEDRVGATFLDDLLTGAPVSPDAVRRMATRLGYDLAVPQLVLVCQHHLAARRGGRPPSATEEGSLQAAIEQELGRHRTKALCRSWEDRAAVLYPVPNGEAPRGELSDLVVGVAGRLGAPVSAGVGSPARSAEGIAEAYREAQGALTLGLRLFGPGRVTHYGDLGLYRLLLAIRDVPELRAFYDETLAKLVEHDRRGNGELVRTLEAYFAGRASPTEAAERLHVHRNTLLYRLRRIQAITGLDLEDPETRLALNLALHVGQVLGQ
jgi:purine catabolism regulator